MSTMNRTEAPTGWALALAFECLAASLPCCGTAATGGGAAEPAHATTPGGGAGAEAGASVEPATGEGLEGGVTAPGVTVSGVEYTVSAAPKESCDGWGVTVAVAPAIKDGKDHSYVSDKPSVSHAEATSIRFSGEVECCGGKWISFDEPAFSGKKALVTLHPGDAAAFSRDYPTKGSDYTNVKSSETLTLTVGIWGTESGGGAAGASGAPALRTSPDLAKVTLHVTKEGVPEISIAPLDPAASQPLDAFVLTVGSHEVTLEPYSPLSENAGVEKGAAVTVVDLSGTVVRIREEAIVVGDTIYEGIPKGAKILVDHGAVTVDGKPLAGEHASNAELIGFYVNQVSEHSIGGYTVTVSPGAGKASMAKDGDVATWSLDGTEIVISAGVLYVNGVDHGKVKKKAKIGIWFGKISVDGKDRAPVVGKGDGGKKGGSADEPPPPPAPNALTPTVMEVLTH